MARVIRTIWTVAIALFVFGAVHAGIAEAQTKTAKQVQLHILVIEADKDSKEIDPRVAKYKDNMPGYTGAKVLDELTATTEEGSKVSLQIMRRSELLEVTVRKVEADGTVKLRVAIAGLKFSTDTTHQKENATFLVRIPRGKDKALFLVVTPKSS